MCFITIGSEKCFKLFANHFARDIGDLRLSEVMNEIQGTAVFRNLLEISSDVSGTLKTMWEYWTLSKVGMNENPGI